MPPMSKSATKVMQFTGRDPTMEIREGTRQRSPLQITTDESDSSGSVYSQDGANSTAGLPVTSLQPPPAHDGQFYLKSTTYSSNSSSHSDPDSISSQAYRECVSRFMSGRIGEPSPSANTRDDIEDLTNQKKVIEEQRGKSGTSVHHEIHHEDHVLTPQPLTIRTNKNGPSYPSKDSGGSSAALSANLQKAVDWNLLRTPSCEKQYGLHNTEAVSSSPVPPTRTQSSPLPSPDQKHNKRGNSSDSPTSTSTIGGKLSGALRRVSEPDTPTPKKSSGGFMGLKGTPDVLQKGNEHFHEVVEKAKLSMNKKEKRRQELKKQIIVVGITDQTPDGRISEWL
ncbi:hypothetical protein ACMFMF_000693 [Clarireedia jacksonii]